MTPHVAHRSRKCVVKTRIASLFLAHMDVAQIIYNVLAKSSNTDESDGGGLLDYGASRKV
jgi:hypothetical protein